MAKEKTQTKKVEKKKKGHKDTVGSRGRIFEGTVVKKFAKRVVIEFERTVYLQKYERFYRKKTRLHVRIPEDSDVKVGDYIKVRQCRPLSKIIHYIFVEKVRSKDQEEAKK